MGEFQGWTFNEFVQLVARSSRRRRAREAEAARDLDVG